LNFAGQNPQKSSFLDALSDKMGPEMGQNGIFKNQLFLSRINIKYQNFDRSKIFS